MFDEIFYWMKRKNYFPTIQDKKYCFLSARVPCLIMIYSSARFMTYSSARFIDIKKYISLASLSASCEQVLLAEWTQGRDSEMHKSKEEFYSFSFNLIYCPIINAPLRHLQPTLRPMTLDWKTKNHASWRNFYVVVRIYLQQD